MNEKRDDVVRMHFFNDFRHILRMHITDSASHHILDIYDNISWELEVSLPSFCNEYKKARELPFHNCLSDSELQFGGMAFFSTTILSVPHILHLHELFHCDQRSLEDYRKRLKDPIETRSYSLKPDLAELPSKFFEAISNCDFDRLYKNIYRCWVPKISVSIDLCAIYSVIYGHRFSIPVPSYLDNRVISLIEPCNSFFVVYLATLSESIRKQKHPIQLENDDSQHSLVTELIRDFKYLKKDFWLADHQEEGSDE